MVVIQKVRNDITAFILEEDNHPLLHVHCIWLIFLSQTLFQRSAYSNTFWVYCQYFRKPLQFFIEESVFLWNKHLQSSLYSKELINLPHQFLTLCKKGKENNPMDFTATKVFYCVKGVQIQSFSSPYFPVFGLNMEKIRTRKNSVFGHFSLSVLQEKSDNLNDFIREN